MLSSKIKTLISDGADPFLEGKRNYEHPKPEIETIAEARSKICKGCAYFEIEPIDFFRVKDEKIPILSNMSCGECGCILSYKTRQSIKICDKWQKD